jgi:hypothetical protein
MGYQHLENTLSKNTGYQNVPSNSDIRLANFWNRSDWARTAIGKRHTIRREDSIHSKNSSASSAITPISTATVDATKRWKYRARIASIDWMESIGQDHWIKWYLLAVILLFAIFTIIEIILICDGK